MRKNSTKRGVSQILGTLFMLAIVVPVGTVIVTKGLNEVGDINNRLASSVTFQNERGQEDIVFEHIRFDPTGNQVTISLRNVGTMDSVASKITMVKTDTQDLVINDNLGTMMQPKVGIDILSNGNLQFTGRWDDPNYKDSEYKIGVTTERGNFFEFTARPYNT
ncbi:MAG: hypothetical protein ACT4OD_05315 [Candidatus Nitrosotenuis sp.]